MTVRGQPYDVIVIGGGPAGSASAITLARAGYRALLIERRSDEEFKVGESLPPAVKPLLRELGLMERFKADGHLPSYGNQSAWGSSRLRSTDFIMNPHGNGWHLNRVKFDAMLRAGAQDAGAETLEATRVNRLSRTADELWQVQLSSGNQLEEKFAPWLIDCTGRSSFVARSLGVKRISYDQLVGFVSLFRAPESMEASDQDSLTVIEAATHGWWYTALISSGRRIVVYFTDADIQTGKLARTADGFIKLVNQTEHIRRKITDSGYALDEGPWATGANSARLEHAAGMGWLAAGDSALSFDPLSSQGICTALYTGIKAGNALHNHLTGRPHALKQFASEINSIYETYLKNRTTFYAYEQRWPSSEFWRRRQDVVSPEAQLRVNQAARN
jgi:flavin-dependent dehydrogenase